MHLPNETSVTTLNAVTVNVWLWLEIILNKPRRLVTTNLAFNRWNEIIDDKVLVTAMVDRLTHKAILLNMTGKSYRMKETQEMMNKQI